MAACARIRGVSLRIACDIDGTLADMESAVQAEAVRLFGAVAQAGSASLTDAQRRALWAHIASTENFWTSLRETEPGAVARLAAAARAHQWEVIFFTQRPRSAGDSTQVQSQRWLQAMGFELPSVYVMPARRGRIAAALDLDVVLDDRRANCLDIVATSNARAVLVWRGSRDAAQVRRVPAGIDVVFSIAEALALTVTLEPSTPRRAAPLMTRVRQALGL
jgi:hypothetical protein